MEDVPKKATTKMIKKMGHIKLMRRQKNADIVIPEKRNMPVKPEDDCVVVEPNIEIIELMEEQQKHGKTVTPLSTEPIDVDEKQRGRARSNAKKIKQLKQLKTKSMTTLKARKKYCLNARRSSRILAMSLK